MSEKCHIIANSLSFKRGKCFVSWQKRSNLYETFASHQHHCSAGVVRSRVVKEKTHFQININSTSPKSLFFVAYVMTSHVDITNFQLKTLCFQGNDKLESFLCAFRQLIYIAHEFFLHNHPEKSHR